MSKLLHPVPVEEVLSGEYGALRPDVDFKAKDQAELFRRAHAQAKPFSALCISGGGIRSATFSLGAIQSLAEHGILEQFDYMSTVSGGGYIGGWLTAWVHRLKGLNHVIPHLRRNAPPPARGEADPIQHLREYNNYLTPRLGALSGDAWTLAATIMRNVFLNWLVLIPLLMCLLMAPRIILSAAAYADLLEELHNGSAVAISSSVAVGWGLPLAAALLFTCCMFNTLRYLPAVGNADHTGSGFFWYVLGPIIGAALLFCCYDSLHNSKQNNLSGLLEVILWMVSPCAVGWLLYLITSCKGSVMHRVKLFVGPLSIAIVLLGVGTGTAAWLLTNELLTRLTWAQYVTVGPPLLLIGFGLAGALFVGLSSRVLQDEDREWLSRGGASLLRFCTIWVASCAVVLLIPAWTFSWNTWGKSFLATVGAVSAWASSLAGYRGSKTAPGQMTSRPKTPLSEWVLKIMPALFIALLAVGLAMVTNALLAFTGSIHKEWWNHDHLLTHTMWHEVLIWAGAFFGCSWIMARFININTFSLEAMYRDRLIRAYLGASNPKRKVNKFTGFSNTDNIRMADLDPAHRPFHVLNLTLNVVAGARLAWQQRKAESFTATPLHCGSIRLGYRPSTDYGGMNGITLGTAMTISGAAASPNMGYHSSPIVGFIMTLFNVRLGAWLGNPGRAGKHTWKYSGPRSAITSLAREALGLTTDESEYVYLSDGGHFENLGLYEMVQRRCRHIVVLDSGCDGDFTYEDLGNALRKIRIDLKIPITFPDESSASLRKKEKRCATATIHYSAVDGDCPDGDLIYIKPIFLGNEPPDVASYHASHLSFPHQSTAEQWFDESQTESYRMLGLHSVDEVFRGWNGGEFPGLRAHVENAYLGIIPELPVSSGPMPATPVTITPALSAIVRHTG